MRKRLLLRWVAKTTEQSCIGRSQDRFSQVSLDGLVLKIMQCLSDFTRWGPPVIKLLNFAHWHEYPPCFAHEYYQNCGNSPILGLDSPIWHSKNYIWGGVHKWGYPQIIYLLMGVSLWTNHFGLPPFQETPRCSKSVLDWALQHGGAFSVMFVGFCSPIQLCRCIYIYIHTYIHTCIHTYIHAYIHTYIHTYI